MFFMFLHEMRGKKTKGHLAICPAKYAILKEFHEKL